MKQQKKLGVTQPYKPTTWNEIPDWAKDEEGHWALAYTGTIAFIVNKDLVDVVPRSWKDLLEGNQRGITRRCRSRNSI